jgi:hypothetical protein
LRRGKHFLVILGHPNSFEESASLQLLLRPTDLITYDPNETARSAKTLVLPIHTQFNDLVISWNSVIGDPKCSIQTRCVNLSLEGNVSTDPNNSCKILLDIAWLTEETEITRVEKISFGNSQNGYLSEDLYAKDFLERYVKVLAVSCRS